MTDEDVLRSLFAAASADLHAPKLHVRPGAPVVPLHRRPTAPKPAPAPKRSWPRRSLITGVAALAGAAAAVVAMLGFRAQVPAVHHPAATHPAGVLYQLASTVRALPGPTGRYAVQIEQQSEGSSAYLKASVIDSRTGDTWTYQRGPGVPAVLPMAPGFSPTEAQLQASDPTDPARLRAALVAQASASHPVAPETPDDLAVTQAIDTLWNPLVEPPLRSALVSVIASSPGVITDAHAVDSKGRKAIEISYDDGGLGVRLSVYLDPSTATVLESSEQPYTANANPALAGHDLYLSQYWTDAAPTTNPLDHLTTPPTEPHRGA